jgi:hypothetical protein
LRTLATIPDEIFGEHIGFTITPKYYFHGEVTHFIQVLASSKFDDLVNPERISSSIKRANFFCAGKVYSLHDVIAFEIIFHRGQNRGETGN